MRLPWKKPAPAVSGEQALAASASQVQTTSLGLVRRTPADSSQVSVDSHADKRDQRRARDAVVFGTGWRGKWRKMVAHFSGDFEFAFTAVWAVGYAISMGIVGSALFPDLVVAVTLIPLVIFEVPFSAAMNKQDVRFIIDSDNDHSRLGQSLDSAEDIDFLSDDDWHGFRHELRGRRLRGVAVATFHDEVGNPILRRVDALYDKKGKSWILDVASNPAILQPAPARAQIDAPGEDLTLPDGVGSDRMVASLARIRALVAQVRALGKVDASQASTVDAVLAHLSESVAHFAAYANAQAAGGNIANTNIANTASSVSMTADTAADTKVRQAFEQMLATYEARIDELGDEIRASVARSMDVSAGYSTRVSLPSADVESGASTGGMTASADIVLPMPAPMHKTMKG